MKNLFFLCAIGIILMACDPKTSSNIADNASHTPGAWMMVVKFANNEQSNEVIVGHPIKKYNGIDGYFEYDENAGISLNFLHEPYQHFYSVSMPMVDFLEREMHIKDYSPYIPLVDGYYLIEWRWSDLLPLSALTNYSLNDQLKNHIQYHIFTTDMAWNDLDDLTQTWDNAQYQSMVRIVDVQRISYKKVDQYFKEEKTTYPFCYYNWALYNDGLEPDNAFRLCRYKEEDPDEYIRYIAYCDSLQNVYKSHLIELIQKDKLKQMSFQ